MCNLQANVFGGLNWKVEIDDSILASGIIVKDQRSYPTRPLDCKERQAFELAHAKEPLPPWAAPALNQSGKLSRRTEVGLVNVSN